MPIVKKIHRLERVQYAFLDYSKTLVFSDVIKIKIIFKCSRARAIRTYTSRGKKLYRATLNLLESKATRDHLYENFKVKQRDFQALYDDFTSSLRIRASVNGRGDASLWRGGMGKYFIFNRYLPLSPEHSW